MRHRLTLLFAAAALALTITGSALAFDCMRVSSSPEGLRQSTQSGNWLYFDMTDGGGGVAQLISFFELPASTVPCFQAAYDASDGPRYFALGIGVAGGRTEHGTGVLGFNAPDKVLTNGTGIDHIDDTVIPIFLAAAPTCLS